MITVGGFLKEGVSVIGLGNFGTALANYLAHLGHKVLGFTRKEDVVRAINSTNRNPEFLREINLSPNISATNNLRDCLRNRYIVIALPAHALIEFSTSLKDLLTDAGSGKIKDSSINLLFISATKGLPVESFTLPTQYLRSSINGALGGNSNGGGSEYCEPVVLTGPCFASDLVRGLPCGLVAASSCSSSAQSAASLFSSTQVKVYISDDPIGAQIGGIVKNIIAIATGISDGLELGESARAGLITRGLAEILRFALANGAKQETIFGLSGLGDLSMTCTSTLSRNHTVGLQLGKGRKLSEILADLGSVAEGVRSAPIVAEKAGHLGVEMPITQSVLSILREEITPIEAVRSLVMRPVKREF